MLEELHYCMRSILDVPEEMHHYICSILHVPEEMHHRIVPEVCISPRLPCARSLHVPESDQVISINRCQKQIRSL